MHSASALNHAQRNYDSIMAYLLYDKRDEELRFILRQASARLQEFGEHRADQVEGLAERLRVVLQESER